MKVIKKYDQHRRDCTIDIRSRRPRKNGSVSPKGRAVMNIYYINSDRFGVVGDFYGIKATETPEGICPDCGAETEEMKRVTQVAEGCVYDGSYEEVFGIFCPVCYWRKMYEEEK